MKPLQAAIPLHHSGVIDVTASDIQLRNVPATVSHLFAFLMKREINLSPHDPVSELELLSELSAEFAAHDNFKLLVKRIVQLPQYGRMQ